MQALSLIMLAIIIEGVVEHGKALFDKDKFHWAALAAMLIGIAVCVAAGVDLFAIVGVPLSIPYLGAGLTGILCSRGANYISDLIGKLNQGKEY